MHRLRTILISLSPTSPIKRAVKLGAIDTPEAARAIIGLAREHHEKLGYGPFAQALKSMRHPALVDVVMEQMRIDKRVGGSLTALSLLEAMKDSRFVPALLVLKDPDTSTAASLLGDIGDRRAVAPLCELLVDETREPYDRSEAAEALGKLADPSALAPLLRVLESEFRKPDVDDRGHPTPETLLTAVTRAVGRIGDDEAIAAMAGLLEGFVSAARTKDFKTVPFRRYEAIVEALWYTRSRRATQGLLSVLEVGSRSLAGRAEAVEESVRRLQRHAIRALGKVADPAALDRILEAYPDRAFTHDAAEALAAFADPRAQRILADHRKRRERCFLCGKDEMQAMLSPSASTLARAGGDRAVASMVSYVEAVRSGKTVVTCRLCGMWACHDCLAAKMAESDPGYSPRVAYACPGCHFLFLRKQLEA
jgi:HEAT repeat protein